MNEKIVLILINIKRIESNNASEAHTYTFFFLWNRIRYLLHSISYPKHKKHGGKCVVYGMEMKSGKLSRETESIGTAA